MPKESTMMNTAMSESEMFTIFTPFYDVTWQRPSFSPSSVSDAVRPLYDLYLTKHFGAPFCREQSDIVSSRPPPQVSSCAKNGLFDSRASRSQGVAHPHTYHSHQSAQLRASKNSFIWVSGAEKKERWHVARSARSPDSCWGKSVSCPRSSPRSFANGSGAPQDD